MNANGFRAATDADRDAWQAFLGSQPSGDFLHDWAWGSVAAFDAQPQQRFVLEEAGEIVAIVAAQVRPLRGSRTFWYVPHGPVLDYGAIAAPDRLRRIIAGLKEVGHTEEAVAVKIEPRIEAGGPDVAALPGDELRPVVGTLQVGQTRLVQLSDDKTLLATFDKDTRYGVRRAEREGVEIATVTDAADLGAIDGLHELVGETQRRAGFPMPQLARYRTAWTSLAGAQHAAIVEARREGRLLASGMLVIEGNRSFYLFSGSHREAPGEPKYYASYLLQWEMMRFARERDVRAHDLWGIAPPGAGSDHPWYGVGLFKKGFGGREVVWAGSWDIVVDPTFYRFREAVGRLKRLIRR